jgi:hypothetical protein
MAFFDINYDLLRTQLLPVRLRTSKTKAWIRCLITPVKWLNNLFQAARQTNLYNLAHNSQVAYMEAVLNDIFDPSARGIFITDGPYEDPLFAYLPTEDRILWLGRISETGSTPYPDPQVLYTNSETSLLGISFIVNVPIAVSFDTGRMRAIIDQYRLSGRNLYTIVTY